MIRVADGPDRPRADLVDDDEPWLDSTTETALRSVVPHAVPGLAVATYSRWWQLETWLRELVYVELRALLGRDWQDALKVATKRQTQDAAFTHMAGADNDNPLAYLDYSQVLDIIQRYWEVTGYSLIERSSWEGRQVELLRIRHRIGHMRRPHHDDLSRLEQTLRDLERGGFMALCSYNRRTVPNADRQDPVTLAWLRGEHPDARLLDHADQRYGISSTIQLSRRPWATWPADLAGAAGIYWHVDFYMRDRYVEPRAVWRDSRVVQVRPLLVHLAADDPMHIGFTFSAVDEPAHVVEAIGSALESVLANSRRGEQDHSDWRAWQRRVRDIDYRVLSGTGWNIVDDTTLPISNFSAGGSVFESPDW